MATTTKEMTHLDEKLVDRLASSSVDSLPHHDDSNAEEEDYTLSGAKLHIIIFGLGLAVFLMALDMSILMTAIPLITEKLESVTVELYNA